MPSLGRLESAAIRTNSSLLATVVAAAIVCGAGCKQTTKGLETTVKDDTTSSATSGVVGEERMSKELKELRDQVLAVKSYTEIDALLANIAEKYPRLPDDAKFVAAQLLPLKTYKGMIPRLKPIFTRTKATHNLALTIVMNASAGQHQFLPTTQWAAGFDYVTKLQGEKPFNSVTEFQEHLRTQVYPAVKTAAESIAGLAWKTPIVWDNKISYGLGDYEDSQDRFALIDTAERDALLSGIQAGLHGLLVFSAYDLDQLPEVVESTGRILGFDAAMNIVEGFPSERRVGVIRGDARFAETFKLKGDAGKQMMADAFVHLKAAVDYAKSSWEVLKQRPANEFNAMDSARSLPWRRPTEHALNTALALVSGETQVRSAVSGEVVTVDLKAFYMNPPADLKNMMPTGFAPAVAGEDRDYGAGRPTSWNVEAYKPYIKSLQSGEDVGRATRIIMQAWGGNAAGLPLTGFVM